MTLIRGGDEAGRDPTIEPADDTLSIVPQERDELLLVLRLDGQDVDKGGDVFRHFYRRVHDVLLQKRCSLRLHHEDDFVSHNGSVGQTKMPIL
jgi:hypothetical protein